MRLVIVGIIAGAALFVGGYITARQTTDKEIKIVHTSEIKYQTVYKDKSTAYAEYSKMSDEQVKAALYGYDNGVPWIIGTVRGDWLHIESGLGKREWSRDFEIAGGQSGGWKLIACVSIAGGIVLGSYVTYKLVRK